MKGISTILATIMIVIIVVALVSLTYTFATNMFSSSTRPAEVGIEQTNKKIDQRVAFIVQPSCQKIGNNWQISFSIRHEGATYSIASSDVAVIFDNAQADVSTSWGSDSLAPGSVKSLSFTNITNVVPGKSYTLTVSAPAGPAEDSVTCNP